MAVLREADVQRPHVLRQIAELQRLSMSELLERWRALMGVEPPPYNKAFLVKRLTYRIQELAYGGLSMAIVREMDRVLVDAGYDALGGEKTETPTARASARRSPDHPVIGTRLIREWRGHRYEVLVTQHGFEFDGRPYKSLTAIAKAITGTQWNGQQFFGLRQRQGGDHA